MHSTSTEPSWTSSPPSGQIDCSGNISEDNSLSERLRSGLSASTRPPSQLHESVKLLGAGGIAGAFSKTCTAPLARLTILYQVAYGSLAFYCCQWVTACQASNPSAVQLSSVQSLFMYRHSCTFKGCARAKETSGLHRRYQNCSLTSPKVSPMLQVQALKVAPTAAGQLSLNRAFSHIVRQEGIAALWKGNAVTVIHRLPYSAINFWAYERLTELWRQRVPPERSNATLDCARRLAAGGLAGSLACAVVSPLRRTC